MRKDVAYMLVIAVVAVLLRAGAGMVQPMVFDDSRDYHVLAKRVLNGDSYEVNELQASRMPGYAVFLAGVYGTLGEKALAVTMTQAVLGGGIVALTFLLAQPMGPRIALVAAALAAVDPLSIGFSAAVLTETLYTLLLMGGLVVAMWLLKGGGYRGWVVLGLVWAVGVYVRASALWCIVPVGAWVVFMTFGGERKVLVKQVVGVVIAMGVMMLMLSPWMTRNVRLFGEGWKFYQLTTLEGISLYESVYKDATGGPRQDKIVLPEEMRAMGEAERDREWRRRAWEEIKAEPGRVAGLAVVKIGRTWSPWLNAEGFRQPLLRIGMAAFYVPLFLLAVMALWKVRMPLALVGLILAPIVYFTAVHAVFLGSVRYRVPLMPLVCILAAVSAVWLTDKLRQGKRV